MTPEKTTGISFQQQAEWGFAEGMARLNEPGIKSVYVRKWLPSLPGGVEMLTKGAKVADLGTGFGALALTLAQSFPNSSVVGVDLDPHSISQAKANLAATALTNVRFVNQDMVELESDQFDLIVNHVSDIWPRCR